MTPYELIRKKRDGGALSEAEIDALIGGFTAGEIPDYQMSAFLMAVFFRGMTDGELFALTGAMLRSGETVDLSRFGGLSADKHSTGGVGDKTTLIVAPLAAALGLKLAKMSGRGLGHTGGTVDKLESIPGFRTELSPEAFLDQTARVGVAVVGASGRLAPADKLLYALRDVTATVDSVPLIASSIMSKKLAAGAKNIVLDVKTGSGAFMKTPEAARELAEKMVAIGRAFGRNTAAVISDMDRPLGYAVGNAIELEEAVRVLKGGERGDVRTLSLALAARLYDLATGGDDGEKKAAAALDSGEAYEVFRRWIAAQGGDVAVLDDPMAPYPEKTLTLRAPVSGYVSHMNAEAIGMASLLLGAGRRVKTDTPDPGAGIRLFRKTGDPVREGEAIAELYTRLDPAPAAETFMGAVSFSAEKPEERPLIFR